MLVVADAEELSTGQTARALDVSVTRVKQLRLAGKLRGRLSPLGWLFDRSDVERLRRERLAATEARA